MAILIDTSVVVAAERGALALDDAVGEQDRAISAITASELLNGVHRARSERIRSRRQAFVEHVLALIEPTPVTLPVARAHAAIWAELEGRGTPIGAHDLWIAATAIAHGMDLATTNARDFERVPGLAVIRVH